MAKNSGAYIYSLFIWLLADLVSCLCNKKGKMHQQTPCVEEPSWDHFGKWLMSLQTAVDTRNSSVHQMEKHAEKKWRYLVNIFYLCWAEPGFILQSHLGCSMKCLQLEMSRISKWQIRKRLRAVSVQPQPPPHSLFMHLFLLTLPPSLLPFSSFPLFPLSLIIQPFDAKPSDRQDALKSCLAACLNNHIFRQWFFSLLFQNRS